ncbi:MAG: GAF domain-containing protein [Bacteroidota bacterium]
MHAAPALSSQSDTAPSDTTNRAERYAEVAARIDALLDGETDWTAAMATVACELHHAFDHYHWTGFYRAVSDALLIIGPYQGGHGCLRIPFDRGVCGAAARTRMTQLVPDVEAFPGHIACAASTRSEVVVPVLTPDGRLLAVLDVDSDDADAFTAAEDQAALEALCARLGAQFADTMQR